ncbi:MAG: sulfatase-like hydrolase/transferase, partial [Flavobacteriaceae bacterium]
VKPTSDYFTNVKASDSSQTYVVIIGESTSSRNMGLYGYYRNTTPLLSSLDSRETIVFKDVISPHTHTIPSLNKALSLANYENPDDIYKGSIVQLANAAGFATYWISNQQPIGIHETLLTAMSKATKKQIFTNALTNKQLEYDEALFPHIQNVLKNEEQKKVIFIHLTGTHIPYKFTYPKGFQHFTDTPKTRFPSDRSTEHINHYDNSILYNDFVVHTIIEEVKKTNSNSYVLYFSDHGDEVFQDLDFVGHNEYHASKPMHEIPFVLWTSEKYKKFSSSYKSLKNYSSRKYMLDDFIHSFSDLSQIKFDQWQPQRSIFNPGFKDRTRIIKNGIDYDNR